MPLPDISAVDPSGFQITTIAAGVVARGDLEHAVRADARCGRRRGAARAPRSSAAASARSTSEVRVAERVPLLEPHRLRLPTRERDHVPRDGGRIAAGVDDDEPGIRRIHFRW